MLFSIVFIIFSKISGALDILKGSLLKQYCPKGVIKVVRSLEGFARGICQNPLLAWSLENSFAPESWPRVSSTCGIGCVSRRTFSFSDLRRLVSYSSFTFPGLWNNSGNYLQWDCLPCVPHILG